MQFWKIVLDFLLPPVCAVCKTSVSEKDTLCPECFKNLHFITKPYCQKCGRPFEFDILGDRVCASCLMKAPLFEKARAVLLYDEMAKKLILPFKSGDKQELVSLLAKMMALQGKELIEEADVLMPIPLHRWRLLKRKYNQSALLANRLSKIFHKTYNPDSLKRVKSTVSQGHLSPDKRRKNVTNAFKVCHKEKIKNQTVLLIDDVLTTGATVNECAKVLLKAGVKKVLVLTFASTPKNRKK